MQRVPKLPSLPLRYRILRPLGQGSAGKTFLAFDRLLEEQVAVKLVRSSAKPLSESIHTEFFVLSQLKHPNLLAVLDFGTLRRQNHDPSPRCFFTSRFIDGPTLASGSDRCPGDWPSARSVLLDLLHALSALHQAGFRHGDVKPSNVLLSPRGSAILIDLGLARPLRTPSTTQWQGTVGFVAPELLGGYPADARADLFSFGATAIALLQAANIDPPRPVRTLLQRLTNPDPAARPVSALAVIEALNATADGATRHTAPSPTAGVAAFVGRKQLLRRLRSALQPLTDAKEGPRTFVVMAAEGMGKSALLRQVKWFAQQRATVIETSGHRPMAVTEALAWATGTESGPNDLRQVAEVHQKLTSNAAQPTVLIIDDAHALDERQAQLLRVLVASTRPDAPLFILAAAAPPFSLPAAHSIELPPLSRQDLAAWFPRLASQAVESLWQVTGGVPGIIVSLLSTLQSTEQLEGAVARWNAQRLIPATAAAEVQLPKPLASTLAVLFLWPEPLRTADLSDAGVRSEHLEQLETQGLALREGPGWRPNHLIDRAGVFGSLRDDELNVLRDRALRWIDSQEAASDGAGEERLAGLLAAKLGLLIDMRRTSEAVELLTSGSLEHYRRIVPGKWAVQGRRLSERTGDEDVELAVTRLERMAGWLSEATERARRGLQRANEERSGAWCYELAEALRRQGKLAEALLVLENASDSTALPWRALLAASRARTLLKLGRYERSKRVALEALCTDVPLGVAGELTECAGLAAAYLGNLAEGRRMLAEARGMAESLDDPRVRVRAHASAGLVEFLAGSIEGAIDAYRSALSVARRHAFVDEAASACLNLGAAYHQQGAFAEALRTYEDGVALARAAGKAVTFDTLAFNRAKLMVDLGQFQRASSIIDECEARAMNLDEKQLIGTCQALRGELAALQQRDQRACQLFEKARDILTGQGSARDLAELSIHIAECYARLGNTDQAHEALQAARKALDDQAVDLEVKWEMARHPLPSSRTGASSLDDLERWLPAVRKAGLRDLEARLHAVIAETYAAMGSAILADQHRRQALLWWEKVSLSLPQEFRDAFWQHRARKSVARQRARDLAMPPSAKDSGHSDSEPTQREHRLRRALRLIHHINETPQTRQVLIRLMDAAIELTEAQRGFLLLASPHGPSKGLRVEIARNFDRQNVDEAKFSRTIAQQVLADGEPVLLRDARQDPRFASQGSVHAMNLRSVLCVPIVAKGKAIGAVYLDNRFSRGRFTDDDLDLIEAVAQHAALALERNRLIDELRKKTRQLETKQKQIEQLARGQAAQIERLEREARELVPAERKQRYPYRGVVGTSPSMRKVFDLLDRVIETDLNVLIEGPTGTGKEVIARAIHTYSPRSAGPWVAVNCGALPENLLESELFGFERGAFTGADRPRKGLMLQAHGGTLFLDEVGEMSLDVQVKLLRALQEREVLPIGASKPIAVDFRLVCATNRDLQRQVDQGRFREDLYYRLSVVTVRLPPLADRAEDLPALARHILDGIAKRLGQPRLSLSPGALDRIVHYSWPGNVRQLENVLLRAAAISSSQTITSRDLDLPTTNRSAGAPGIPNRDEYRRREHEEIVQVLEQNRWNVSKTARQLGIPRPTLYRRLREMGLTRRK